MIHFVVTLTLVILIDFSLLTLYPAVFARISCKLLKSEPRLLIKAWHEKIEQKSEAHHWLDYLDDGNRYRNSASIGFFLIGLCINCPASHRQSNGEA